MLHRTRCATKFSSFCAPSATARPPVRVLYRYYVMSNNARLPRERARAPHPAQAARARRLVD